MCKSSGLLSCLLEEAMGHRQHRNSFSTFGNAQSQHQNYISEQPFGSTGSFAASSGSFVQPGDVLPSGEDRQLNSRSIGNQYNYTNSSMEAAHFLPQISGPPPYVPFPQSSAAGNLCIPGSNGLQPRHYDSLTNEYGGGLADHPPHPSIHRGLFKRKRSSISGHCERGGSSSRFYDGGSSSGSSGMLRPIPENENIPSNHTGFHHRSSSISINADESWRNVRRRYSFDSGRDTERTHIPNYTSVQHQFTTHPTHYSGITNIRSTVGSSTGRNLHPDSAGSSYQTNPFYFGEGAADISAHHRSCMSTGNFNSSSHHTGRILHPNGNVLGHPQLGYAATPTENSMHSSAETFSFRNMRAVTVEGWCNRSQHGSFGATNERVHSLSSVVHAGDRMRSEVQPLMFEQQSFSDGAGNLFDEYGGMRLDVDSMSYEELLALGERIGNVNTGLSEDMASKCMTAEAFVSSHGEHKSCAICLEAYEGEEEVGTLMKCGHDYHVKCISKWLSMKNVCPICKSAALVDEEN